MTNKSSTIDEFINDMSSNEAEYNRMINKSKEFVKKEVDYQCKDKKNTYYLTKHNYQYYSHFLDSDIFQLDGCLVLSQKGRYCIDEYCVNITNNELINYNIDRMNEVVFDRINHNKKWIDDITQYIIKLIDYLKTNNIILSETLDKLQNFEDVVLYNIDGNKTSGVIKMQNIKTTNFVYVDYSVLKEFHQSQFNHYIFYFNDLFKKRDNINDLLKLKSFRDCKFVPLKEYIKTCTLEQYNALNQTSPISMSDIPFEPCYFYPIEICKDVELPIKQPPPLPEDLVVRTDDKFGDFTKSELLICGLTLSAICFIIGMLIVVYNPNSLLYVSIGCIMIGFLPTIIVLLDKNINK